MSPWSLRSTWLLNKTVALTSFRARRQCHLHDAGNSGPGKAPDVSVAEAFPPARPRVRRVAPSTSSTLLACPASANTGNAAGTFRRRHYGSWRYTAGQYASSPSRSDVRAIRRQDTREHGLREPA